MKLFKPSIFHAFLCGGVFSTASGDGGATGDKLIESWLRDLSGYDMPEMRSLFTPDRHCYYCRSAEFSSSDDNIGGECFTPDTASTTFRKIG